VRSNPLCFLLTLAFTVATYAAAFGQTGRGAIAGKITDYETQEGLPSTNIRIEGQPFGTNSDLDGNFLLTSVPVGTYNIVITYLGYKSDTLRNIAVKKDLVTQVDHKLVPEGAKLGAVEIIAERTVTTSTEMSTISEIRNSMSIASGISSQMISRSLDNNAGEVVKRIPGITIAGERFVVVRGLPERYSVVFLNDVLTPSAESDKRAFSFDLVPSNLLDRMIVYKTPAPELPGDFAGAAIKIYTRNTSDNRSVTANIGFGYRAGMNLNNEFPFQNVGTGTDFLGFDNGARQLPGAFPSGSIPASSAQQLPNTWVPRIGTAPLDYKVGFNYYDGWKLGTTRHLRSLTSVTYSSTYERFNVERNELLTSGAAVILNGQTPGPSEYNYRWNDNQGDVSVRLGLLQNFTLVLNERNRLEFKNFFNQMGQSRATVRRGFSFSPGPGFDLTNLINYYSSRTLYSGNVSGFHALPNDHNIDWNVGYSYAARQQPDFRRMRVINVLSSTQVFTPTAGISDNTVLGRFYSNIDENAVSAGANYEKKYESGWMVRAGTFNEYKWRAYGQRLFGVTKDFANTGNNALPPNNLPADQIFDPRNFRADGTGFRYNDNTRPNDSYTAANQLHTLYGSVNIPVTGRLEVYTGLRAEWNRQTLEARDLTGTQPVRVDNPVLSILPSLNVNFKATEKAKVRLAYAWTVNRPELRELAPFSFYDLIDLQSNIFGNPNLKVAQLQNVDLRLEFYPSLDELIQVGGFFKYFENPIEFVITGITGAEKNYGWQNAGQAISAGAEVEIKKRLDFISGAFFNNLTFMFNGAYVFSRVSRLTDVNIDNRPLQGQSPYVVNTGLFYNYEPWGLQVNAMYNVYGPRIFAVGIRGPVNGVLTIFQPNIVENPRNTIDVSVTKRIRKWVDVKVGVQDILNQPTYFFQDWDNNGYLSSADVPFILYRPGTTYSLSLNFKFK
jgi:outer membrane receptor protein involved in Fe transport